MRFFSAEQVKQSLFSAIKSLMDRRDEFLTNPDTDFTRTKKISFEQTILFPMIAGSDNVASELLDFFGEDNLPLPSAMVQRRSQVKPLAFLELFLRFTSSFPVIKTFHGYQLVSHDGSRLNLPYNPSDSYSFTQCIEGRKGINQVHMNALYDILNDVFLDVELQGIFQMDEKKAFCEILDRQKDIDASQKRIYIADRGFASYNIFAHCLNNNQWFLIRVPERFAKGVCTKREHWLEEDCVDEKVVVNIGRRNTQKNKQLENYHHIANRTHYDFIETGSDETDRQLLRVLKFPIAENSFEYIITNLPRYAFSLATIKELYNLRWGEETAFRHLKYAGNMVHIHSLKKDFLFQEIYAKLTAYNFSSFIAAAAVLSQNSTGTCKYSYKINHTQLQKTCIRFLKGTVQDVISLILRFVVPIRPGRKFERNLRRQSADTLTYR